MIIVTGYIHCVNKSDETTMHELWGLMDVSVHIHHILMVIILLNVCIVIAFQLIICTLSKRFKYFSM